MTEEQQKTKETPKIKEKSSPKKSRGFLIVLLFLLTLILIALFFENRVNNGDVEYRQDVVLGLLQKGALERGSIRIIQEERRILGKIVRTEEEKKKGLPVHFLLSMGLSISPPCAKDTVPVSSETMTTTASVSSVNPRPALCRVPT